MLKRFIILIIAVFIILKALEVLYSFLLDCNNNLKSSYRIKEKIDAQLLVLGASSAQNMFDPSVFEEITGLKVYNLATNNSSPAENLAHLHLYLSHNLCPQYLLIEVSPRTLDDAELIFNTYRVAHHLDDTLVKRLVKEEDPFFYSISWIPFMRYGYYNAHIHFNAVQGARHYLSGQTQSYYRNGFFNPNYRWTGDLTKHLQDNYEQRGMPFTHRRLPAGSQAEGFLYKWSKQRERHVKELIRYASNRGIKVILYKAPIFHTVKPYLLNRDERLRQIDKLAGQAGIEYWNFDTLSIAYNQQYYYSYTHTNKKGTRILTAAIACHFID